MLDVKPSYQSRTTLESGDTEMLSLCHNGFQRVQEGAESVDNGIVVVYVVSVTSFDELPIEFRSCSTRHGRAAQAQAQGEGRRWIQVSIVNRFMRQVMIT